MKLKTRALQWLSQREHSRSELRGKLLRAARRAAVEAGADANTQGGVAEVEALLEWLEQHQYLSPTRFVESRVRARVARQGNRRILGELAMHGLTPDAATLERLQRSEYGRALALWRRRFAPLSDQAIAGADLAADAADDAPASNVRDAGPAEKARQMRFLAARGFSSAVIRRVLRTAPDEVEGAATPPGFDED
jgi:regulatory protein